MYFCINLATISNSCLPKLYFLHSHLTPLELVFVATAKVSSLKGKQIVFLMATLISDHCISPKPFKLTYYCAEENRCFGVKVLSPPILPVVTDLLIFCLFRRSGWSSTRCLGLFVCACFYKDHVPKRQ